MQHEAHRPCRWPHPELTDRKNVTTHQGGGLSSPRRAEAPRGRDGRATLAHLLSRGLRRDGAGRSGRVRRRHIPIPGQKRRAHSLTEVSPKMCWRRRTLPPGPPGSTIRAAELNDRVRDGNGCILCAKTTSDKPSDKHRDRKWVSSKQRVEKRRDRPQAVPIMSKRVSV